MPPESPTSVSPTSPFSSIEAILFDLDGVLTPTVDVHIGAWARLFAPYLAERGVQPGYTNDDYFAHIDGRPRIDGVRELLASRGMTIPEGTAEDAPGTETVWGLGLQKNDEFSAVLESEGVAPYPGSLAFLDAAQAAGLQIAVVSSSRNARRVLEVAGIRDRFAVVVDGLVSEREGLPGKPRPDTYSFAAALLGLPPAACAVFEDAHSGVQAGRAGDFGLVVGIDRGVGAEGLLASGADIVVADLADLIPFVALADPLRETPAQESHQ
jgi:beta-phosphoglucomutase family hydrolase